MQLTLPFITAILIVHWIGDYALQFNIMAEMKGKSMLWLTLHVLAYTSALAIFSFIYFPWALALKYTAINAGLHFITDFITSRLSLRFRDTPRIFYPIIGFDQLIHVETLLATCYYMT